MVEVYVRLIESGLRTVAQVEKAVPKLIDAIKERLIEDGFVWE